MRLWSIRILVQYELHEPHNTNGVGLNVQPRYRSSEPFSSLPLPFPAYVASALEQPFAFPGQTRLGIVRQDR